MGVKLLWRWGVLRGLLLLLRNPGLLRFIPRLMFDRRVPLGAKLLLVLAVGYLLSPIDLVPDFLPIRGRLDDILIILLSLASLLGTAPKEALSKRQGDDKEGPESGPVVEGTFRVKREDEGKPEAGE